MEPSFNFDQLAYIHKANAQELGYRGGRPHKAGRYFYVSKNCLDFFPPLSEVVLNDHVFLEVTPPFSEDVVLTNFVFHNDSTASDGTRNEYRIYLNNAIDPRGEFFEPEDIIVFLKVYVSDTAEEDGAQKSFIYKLLRYTLQNSEYQKLGSILEAVDRRSGSHALVQLKELTFLDGLRRINFGKKIIPNEVIDEALNEPAIHEISAEAESTRIMRSRSFRDLVLYFYEYKCAITGNSMVIDHQSFINLEAAHICARAAGGGSHPSNGLSLERNLHWAFDKGFFTINDDFTIKVHPEAMRIPYLNEKDGVHLNIPQDSRSQPSLESLRWHRENVFGIFLRGE